MNPIIQDIINDEGKLIFVLICFVALSELIAGFVLLMKAKSFVKNANRVQANITKTERVRSGNSTYTRLYINFTDQMGNTVEATVPMGQGDFKEGDKVEILYDKNRPKKVKRNLFAQLYLIPVAIFFSCFSSVPVHLFPEFLLYFAI